MEDITLGEIHRNLTTFIEANNAGHDSILKQVTYTNGKVGELVKWRERLKGSWLTIGVFATILSFVIPLLINWAYSQKNINDEVNKMVEKKMSEYIELDN